MNDNYMIPVIHFAPEIMERGEGSYLIDVNGNKYLDLNSGQFCTVLGHNNKYITDKIVQSANKLTHTATSILSDDVVKASKKIYEISGDMKAYSIFLSSGSEGIEFALRYAKHIKNKDGLVCFDKGYHGLSLGSQSVTYSGQFAKPHINNIHTIKTETIGDNVEELEEVLKNNSDICAFVAEPIVSVGGMILPSKEWFKNARKVCDKYDVLLIFDECQTGFGRTGNWFAYQTYNVVPDMVVTAKGIGLGYPVSVVMFREELVKNGFGMTHYSSHQNDSFAGCIISAGIDYITENNVLEKVKTSGEYLKNELNKLSQRTSKIKDVRGLGLMIGCDLCIDGVYDYRQTYQNLSKDMMSEGVIIQGTNGGKTLRFLPDYLISQNDIDIAIATLEQVLRKY